ncbi:MAG: 2-C-methyl-D-erythritol 4-phosphate cytidylyltransferase [Alkalibacterium sp.]|nr:2-C-methyl-D-erythritol 4-phosphate cytidylyltransferase [Alkalibacterium sp.]
MSGPYDVILLAAGSATRFNHQANMNKVLMQLNDRPVFDYSLRQFLTDAECQTVWVVVREAERSLFEEKCRTLYKEVPDKIRWVTGGDERQDSVSRALKQLPERQPEVILVHDAARPFINQELVQRLLDGLTDYRAVIPGVKAKDTMKLVSESMVDQSLDRSTVRHIQTPQAFRTDCLIKAVKAAEESRFYGNEEGELIERLGMKVHVIDGLEQNIKITTALDYVFARFLVEENQLDGVN